MDCKQALYFSLPLVSRFRRVSRSARNIGSPQLAHKAHACNVDYDGVSLMQVVLTGIQTAQYSYDYYVFLLRLFLSLNYSREKQKIKTKEKAKS